jgi:FAD/FMN-containing dehydrogenase
MRAMTATLRLIRRRGGTSQPETPPDTTGSRLAEHTPFLRAPVFANVTRTGGRDTSRAPEEEYVWRPHEPREWFRRWRLEPQHREHNKGQRDQGRQDATAFTGRDAAFWISAEIYWDDPALDEECRAWSRAAMRDVEPHAMVGRYVNDVAETAEGVAQSIYGDAKYDRLVALKRTWDPDNVFRLNQNIRP